MTKTIEKIQKRLLELAQEKRAEQQLANRQTLHNELTQQYKGEDDPADFFAGLVE